MELKLLSSEALLALYNTELKKAFPAAELKSYAGMERLRSRNAYLPLGVFDQNDLVGYSLLWGDPKADYLLLDYLGVTEARRNGGIGAKILHLLRDTFKDKSGILGEVESPDGGAEDELRLRRLNFYRRNDFTKMDYDCVLFGVLYDTMLLSPNGKGTDAAAQELHRKLYMDHLPEKIAQRYVSLPRDPNAPPQPLVSQAEFDCGDDEKKVFSV
ncbi:MAG: GNAT family N-acetyltransferase [Evtepia sp.]